MCKRLDLIFWNKIAGKAGRYVFLSESTKYTYLILYALFRIWKRWDCSGLESKQFGNVPWVIFLRENDKINESWRNRQQERAGRGAVMFLWEWAIISGKPNSKIVFWLFNPNCNWTRLLRSVLPSFIALARKANRSFPQFVIPLFFRHFGQQ